MQGDLFDYTAAPKYPEAAGHRGVDTSIEAADKVDRGGKKEAHELIATYLAHSCGSTGSELAEQLGMPILYIRPRLTEMQALYRIEDSGQRRKNAGGSNERVFRLCLK